MIVWQVRKRYEAEIAEGHGEEIERQQIAKTESGEGQHGCQCDDRKRKERCFANVRGVPGEEMEISIQLQDHRERDAANESVDGKEDKEEWRS